MRQPKVIIFLDMVGVSWVGLEKLYCGGGQGRMYLRDILDLGVLCTETENSLENMIMSCSRLMDNILLKIIHIKTRIDKV